jgi:hypothetical protein
MIINRKKLFKIFLIYVLFFSKYVKAIQFENINIGTILIQRKKYNQIYNFLSSTSGLINKNLEKNLKNIFTQKIFFILDNNKDRILFLDFIYQNKIQIFFKKYNQNFPVELTRILYKKLKIEGLNTKLKQNMITMIVDLFKKKIIIDFNFLNYINEKIYRNKLKQTFVKYLILKKFFNYNTSIKIISSQDLNLSNKNKTENKKKLDIFLKILKEDLLTLDNWRKNFFYDTEKKILVLDKFKLFFLFASNLFFLNNPSLGKLSFIGNNRSKIYNIKLFSLEIYQKIFFNLKDSFYLKYIADIKVMNMKSFIAKKIFKDKISLGQFWILNKKIDFFDQVFKIKNKKKIYINWIKKLSDQKKSSHPLNSKKTRISLGKQKYITKKKIKKVDNIIKNEIKEDETGIVLFRMLEIYILLLFLCFICI